MVIHHSLMLLSELHQLEHEIQRWEEFCRNQGLELDLSTILELLLLEKQKTLHRTLTDSPRVS